LEQTKFSKRLPCDSAYLIALDVYLEHIQTQCFKTDHAKDITAEGRLLHSVVLPETFSPSKIF